MGYEDLISKIEFDSSGLVPVIVQDFETGEVLMLAYMNSEALLLTLKSGKAHFWSRSRNRIWMKGEKSGHIQMVKEIRIDCDGDAILLKVHQIKAACHTGFRSCFYRKLDEDGEMVVDGDKVFEPEEIYGE